MVQRLYYLAWQLTLPGMPKRFWHLIEKFGSPEDAWKASERQLVDVGGFDSENARELVLRRLGINPEAEMNFIERKGFKYLCFDDAAYPGSLKNIFDPPPGLFVKGDLKEQDSESVAIVGARKASAYGQRAAKILAGELVASGITVVSGLAVGIDTAAHQGALSAGGRTIAVLGCGLDIPYPRANLTLKDEIACSGAVVSEFPLGARPDAWHFPFRNRIISGLSKGIVVVEAARKSGALITADFALEQGKEVMAVPGNITSQLSEGTNNLIRQGARPVQNAEDILEDLGFGMLFKPKETVLPHNGLDSEQQKIIELVSTGLEDLDQIIERSGLSAQRVLVALTFLEMKGLIRQLPGKRYYLS